MIAQLLESVAGRSECADATRKTDDTLSLTLDDGDVAEVTHQREEQTFLRVLSGGRVGHAAVVGVEPESLVAGAIASAANGREVPLLLPRPSPLPAVATNFPQAAVVQADELVQVARALTERLRCSDRRVQVGIERSAGMVAVGNSRGVEARYQISCISVDAAVETGRESVQRISANWSGCTLPDAAALSTLAAQLDTQLEWSARSATAAAHPRRVVLLPAALASILAPLRQLLMGEGPIGTVGHEEAGEPWLSPLLTLSDEPLLHGRPASRPIDDEGVTCWSQILVREGRLQRTLTDLESGALAGVPATGHARRTRAGRPRATWSNVVVEAGQATDADLFAQAGESVVIGALASGPQARGGTFSLPIALGWALSGGEIAGKLDSAILSGNTFDVLRQIVAVGADRVWVGSQLLPAMVVEGLRFAGRRA